MNFDNPLVFPFKGKTDNPIFNSNSYRRSLRNSMSMRGGSSTKAERQIKPSTSIIGAAVVSLVSLTISLFVIVMVKALSPYLCVR